MSRFAIFAVVLALAVVWFLWHRIREIRREGAALVGGVGVGLYPDFSLIESMNRTVEVIDPDPAAQAVYQKTFPIFEAAYHALVPVYDLIAEANEA